MKIFFGSVLTNGGECIIIYTADNCRNLSKSPNDIKISIPNAAQSRGAALWRIRVEPRTQKAQVARGKRFEPLRKVKAFRSFLDNNV